MARNQPLFTPAALSDEAQARLDQASDEIRECARWLGLYAAYSTGSQRDRTSLCVLADFCECTIGHRISSASLREAATILGYVKALDPGPESWMVQLHPRAGCRDRRWEYVG